MRRLESEPLSVKSNRMFKSDVAQDDHLREGECAPECARVATSCFDERQEVGQHVPCGKVVGPQRHLGLRGKRRRVGH